FDDCIGQRRQKTIHQPCQALRVVFVMLGYGGESADIAEQDSHPTFFAAQHQFLGRARQLLHERGRKKGCTIASGRPPNKKFCRATVPNSSSAAWTTNSGTQRQGENPARARRSSSEGSYLSPPSDPLIGH